MTAHSLLSWVVVGNVQGVRSALAAGADANQKDERGCSAIHLAVSYRRKEIISVLIAAGADITMKNPEGDDALDMAARRDDVEILDAIDAARKKA